MRVVDRTVVANFCGVRLPDWAQPGTEQVGGDYRGRRVGGHVLITVLKAEAAG